MSVSCKYLSPPPCVAPFNTPQESSERSSFDSLFVTCVPSLTSIDGNTNAASLSSRTVVVKESSPLFEIFFLPFDPNEGAIKEFSEDKYQDSFRSPPAAVSAEPEEEEIKNLTIKLIK